MSLLNITRTLWKGKRKASDLADVERDRSLRVFLNDTRCELVLSDKAGLDIARYERLAENDSAPEAMLATSIQSLPPDTEKYIGNVEVFIDDPELSVVDSRQAKL